MAINRYRNTPVISGSFYGTFEFPKIDLTKIPTFTITPTAEDRLDTLAFKYLGSGEYWWVLAIMNDIGWMFDFEPGKNLLVPVSLNDFLRLI